MILALEKCTMFERKSTCTQQTQHICITFIQRRPNVFDVGTTLYEVMQMFCVYWCQYKLKLGPPFDIPAVTQSVSLQANDQLGARALYY